MERNDRAVFRADARGNGARLALMAGFWLAVAAAARRRSGPLSATGTGRAGTGRAGTGDAGTGAAGQGADPEGAKPAPSRSRVRRAWLEAFAKEQADVAKGLTPPGPWPFPTVIDAVKAARDVLGDVDEVSRRRARRGAAEARLSPGANLYPAYFTQNFHFQTGGWLTDDSARRYEAQVETLFTGAAGAMRRRALALLATAMRGTDQRGVRIVDLACGSGAFLKDLSRTFPKAGLIGVDLSPAYVREARRRTGRAIVQAQAERLPLRDGSVEAVTCIYLFHELPPRVRREVLAEVTRALSPGGTLILADAVQPADAPDLAGLLQAFPALFHEPYFTSWLDEDVEGLAAAHGLSLVDKDQAFLTTAWRFRKG